MRGEIFIIVLFYLCIFIQSKNIPDKLVETKMNLLNKQKRILTNYNIFKFKPDEITNQKEESNTDNSFIQNDIIVFAQNDTKNNTSSGDGSISNTKLLIIIGSIGGGVILILIIIIIIVGVKNKKTYSKLQNEVNKISFKDGNKRDDEEDDDKEDTLT